MKQAILSIVACLCVAGCEFEDVAEVATLGAVDAHGGNGELWPQRASFLFDGASTRAMNMLSYEATDAQFSAVLERQRANGDNVVWLYASNQADGLPRPTSIYAGLFGGEIDKGRVAMMRRRMKTARDKGMRIVLWLTADDSPAISGASVALHEAHVDAVVRELGDLADAYCWGLEANEDARGAIAPAMIKRLKAKGGKDVGIHLTTGCWKQAGAWDADTLYGQVGFGKTADEVRAFCVEAVAGLGGNRRFVLAEYHKSSDTATARALGDAAMDVDGVDGVGNGCN